MAPKKRRTVTSKRLIDNRQTEQFSPRAAPLQTEKFSPRVSPRSPRTLHSPRPLLTPVNAYSSKPRFTIVEVKLDEEQEVSLSWLEHIRDIVSLPVPAFGHATQTAEPVRLAPWLWLGDASQARDVDALKRLKVNAIVNVAGDDFQRKPKYPGSWDYLKIDLPSEFEEAYYRKDALLGANFQRIFVFMERSVEAGRKLFVHCMTGLERSATVCVAFLMLWNQWTLPKALRWVVALKPGSLESQALQEELLAIAKVNSLLEKDEDVSQLVKGIQSPIDEIWNRAAGDATFVDGRRNLVDSMKSLCMDIVDAQSLDTDLASLENSRGIIHYESFKNWFTVGMKRASDLERNEKVWKERAREVWKVAAGDDCVVYEQSRIIQAMTSLTGNVFEGDDLNNVLGTLKNESCAIERERFEKWFVETATE